MDNRSQTFLDFCTRPQVVALIDDPRPAWIFSQRGTEFLWANAAGARLFGARSMTDLLDQRFANNSSSQKIISKITQTGSTVDFTKKSLHFFIGLRSLNLNCNLKKISLDRRNSAALVVSDIVAEVADADPRADFCDLLMTEHTAAIIFDADGKVLAEAGLEDLPSPVRIGGQESGSSVLKRFQSKLSEDILQINDASFPALVAKCQIEDRTFALAVVDRGTTISPGGLAGASVADRSAAHDNQSAPLLIDPQNMRILPAYENARPAAGPAPLEPETTEQAGPQETGTGETTTRETAENPPATAHPEVRSTADLPAPAQPQVQSDVAATSYPVQFVWQMNGQEEFTFLSPEFGRAMNLPTTDIVGKTWQETRRTFGLDGGNNVARALMQRDTWSGITVDWPVDNGRLLCPVDLAALPAFDHEGAFTGYRGFGVCHTDRMRRADSANPAPESEATMSGRDQEQRSNQPERQWEQTASQGAPEQTQDGPHIGSAPPRPSEPQPAADSPKAAQHDSRNTSPEAERPSQSDPGPESIQLARSDHNVVRIVTAPSRNPAPSEADNLSKPEKDAFRKIAEALGARLSEDAPSSAPQQMPSLSDGPYKSDPIEEDVSAADGPLHQNLSDSAVPATGTIDPRILDRLPIGVAIVHLRDVLYCNDTMLELLGYQSINELSNAGGLEAIFAEPEEWPDTENTTETDQSVHVRMKNGELKRVDARLHTVPWRGGNGLMISLHDLTDRKVSTEAQTAEPLFEEISEDTVRVAELEAILETATDGIIIMTADGIVQGVNRSAEALFGRNRDELIGGEFAACLAPESRRSTRDYISGLTQNGVASVLNDGREVIGLAEAGGMIPLFMTVGRINTEGDDIKLCAVLRDITQWKKAEEELTSASREAELASSQKSDFLAKISHEIRTPLNAIIGFSEVMMEERFGPIGNERYREYLLDIHNSGTHIMSLINDLLDLSKIEAGKLDLTFESVSINDIIRECVALMQPQANRDRIIIRASLPTSIPNVVADARSLRQIVLNLLSNAIKFNNPGGQVIISTVLEDSGELFLRIRDTGIGMNKKDLKLALEPFRQLHTSRLGGGTGLGLPLTKALAEANRALFNLESEAGEGTLVEITFPAQRVLVE